MIAKICGSFIETEQRDCAGLRLPTLVIFSSGEVTFIHLDLRACNEHTLILHYP